MTAPPPFRILVFRLGAMGDILFTTPALRALKAAHPGAHLTCATLRQWRFLLKDNPSVDRVVGLRYCHPRALGPLARQSFDLLVNLDESPAAAQTCQAISAHRRLGNNWDGNRIVPDAEGNLLSRTPESRAEQHRAGLSFAELYCRTAGVRPDALRFEYHPGRFDAWRARRILRRSGLDAGPAPVALHLHSRGSRSRSWSAKATLEVVRALPGERFLVLGHTAEREATRLLEAEPNVAVDYHRIWLQAGMIRRCALFVGIDSGPRNLASALGVPLLWLCGPMPPDLMPPLPGEQPLCADWPCAPCFQEDCPLGNDCLGRIDPPRTAQAIRDALARLRGGTLPPGKESPR